MKETTISKGNSIETAKKTDVFGNIDGEDDSDLKESGDLEEDYPQYVRPGVSFTLSGSTYSANPPSAVQLVSRTADSFTFKLNPNVDEVVINVDGARHSYTSKRKELV